MLVKTSEANKTKMPSTLTWSTAFLIFHILMMGVWVPVVAGDNIFTSSHKVSKMVSEERLLLEQLKSFIDDQAEKVKLYTQFYQERVRSISSRETTGEPAFRLDHPNAVYSVIKQFAQDYSSALGDHFEFFHRHHKGLLADQNDTYGAGLSLLRLQVVYNLHALDMAKGDYLGYQGPQLNYVDAYDIGYIAFTKGKLNQSLDWLNTSLVLYDGQMYRDFSPTLGAIKALLGRVHLFKGDANTAHALYEEAERLDPSHGDVQELGRELWNVPDFKPEPPRDYYHNFSVLCSLDKGTQPAPVKDPRIRCRYKPGYLPYYRFKEEILSVSPYASVFYDFTSDCEVEQFKLHVDNALYRALVGGQIEGVSENRISEIAWIEDREVKFARDVSLRIESATRLKVFDDPPRLYRSSEDYQVVNYGIGGTYEPHLDLFESVDGRLDREDGRIATFLIYLSDVERGGATVFTKAGVSVTPKKNMALFWFNFQPSMTLDEATMHAGCPVLIGHKWITNKWIRVDGNTFRRRCGLNPGDDQLDIEARMDNNWQ